MTLGLSKISLPQLSGKGETKSLIKSLALLFRGVGEKRNAYVVVA